MAPATAPLAVLASTVRTLRARAPDDPTAENNTVEQVIVEAWGQGFNVGALILLILLVLCNYRRHVLLHKLILLELVLAIGHGFFIFFKDPVYGWVLSGTAAPLYVSYTLHNIVAWLKIKPFLPRWGARVFIVSVIAVQPYWILETWANFQYFNVLGHTTFKISRFLEPLFRDPWWVFTTVKLVLVINKNYEISIVQLVRASPRFGVMLFCLFISIVFLVTDVVFTAAVVGRSGINPFWRLALVFKCASDVIFLDDFKVVLDRISESVLRRFGNIAYGNNDPQTFSSRYSAPRRKMDARHMSVASAAANRRSSPGKYGDKYGDNMAWPERRMGNRRSIESDDEVIMDDDSSMDEECKIGMKPHGSMSEQATTRETSSSSMKPFAMGDDIFPVETSGGTNRGWDPLMDQGSTLPSSPQASSGTIPMMPMKAKTKDKRL